MNYFKKCLTGLLAVTAVFSATASCSKTSKKTDNNNISPQATASETDDSYTGNPNDSDSMDIVWLADYDLNPSDGSQRSSALAIFEDYYGGKINYVRTTPDNKFTDLEAKIASGERVDMFPYETQALPYGTVKNLYAPLDPYYDILGMDTELWSDMTGVVNMFAYNNSHYVIPYSVSDPMLITYSRKIIQEEGLSDPYQLYSQGNWDWNTFLDLMNKYIEKAPEDTQRYGICGDFGQAMLTSTGHTVINYQNGALVNNIADPELEKAGDIMKSLADQNIYRCGWKGYFFPADHNTLFFAMQDWSLGVSNAKNSDMDLMVVPFPKDPSANTYYSTCDYNARMLVKNSDRGKAVATYIRCERLAATNQKLRNDAKQQAITPNKTDSGYVRSFVTEEQYNAIQTYLDPSFVTPLFDFGCGMGSRMYGPGDYNYETRGVMDNLAYALLEDRENAPSWAALRDKWNDTINNEITLLNQ